MSEAVKNLFTAISPSYDRLNRMLSFSLDRRWRDKTVAAVAKNRDEAFAALDVCAGTHDMGLACLKRFPKSAITALDFSPGMLEAGRGKAAAAVAAGKILPVCADALAMPFADATFDVAFCAYGARNFDDTARGLAEIRRVLKPGGQLLVLEFFRPASPLSVFFHATYARFVLPAVGGLVSGHRPAYAYLKNSIRGFLSAGEFSELLEKTGFSRVAREDFLLSVSTRVSAFKS